MIPISDWNGLRLILSETKLVGSISIGKFLVNTGETYYEPICSRRGPGMSQVRVRFAPSPTGYLDIGGVRTALLNWLFARHEKGVVVLRIVDIDVEGFTLEAIRAILDGLQWVGRGR